MPGDPNEINIATVTGPPFVSVITNWALFGVLSIQVYLYFQAFPTDRRPVKSLVLGVYFLEMVQTFLLTQTGWKMLVQGFGNIEGLNEVGTSWFSVECIGGLVGLLVQWFYAYRIAVISQKRILPGFIMLVSLISFGGALATAVNTKQSQLFTNLLLNESKTFTLAGIWAAGGSVCDVMIAICMCYYLRRRTSQYRQFSRTEALVSKLIHMTIETGVLTASLSTLILVLYYAPSLRHFTYWEPPLSTQAKIYSTTMLAVLNSRMKFAIISESTTWRDNELHPRESEAIRINIGPTSRHLQTTNVFVTMEEVITTDEPKNGPDSTPSST